MSETSGEYSGRSLVLIAALACLLGAAALSSAVYSSLSWAAEICHIHPAGYKRVEPKDREPNYYGSIDECEASNKKLYGGMGWCHCFTDEFLKGSGDWRDRQRDFKLPQEQPNY
jgi:hypothetical protein